MAVRGGSSSSNWHASSSRSNPLFVDHAAHREGKDVGGQVEWLFVSSLVEIDSIENHPTLGRLGAEARDRVVERELRTRSDGAGLLEAPSQT